MSRWFRLLTLIVLTAPAVVYAQAPAAPDPDETQVLEVQPAGEPVPALKYQLLPDPSELVPGNAAVFYHRAILMVQNIRYTQAIQTREENQDPARSPEIDISEWIGLPLEEIPLEKARVQIGIYQNTLREVELGALRSDCDWGFENRPETITLMLPEIQEIRTLGRLISLKVRLALLDGEIDEALQWLQTGYAMSRHVSQGPTIIQALVGIAISSMLNSQLLELIQTEGSPNLYWAIAGLPRPLIDMTRPLLSGERTMIDRMLPDLKELDGEPWSVERGRRFVEEVENQLEGIMGDPVLNRMTSRLGIAALVAKVYPAARRALIEEGRTEAEVEAMPTVQVAVLYTYQRYRALSDDLYKWTSLPYWQSHRHFDEVLQSRVNQAKTVNPLLAVFSMLIPAINAAKMAEVRLERQFAAIQCVEAIRLYADAHEGALPPTLDEITQAPAPIDPATGKQFEYSVEGESATLSAPNIPGAPDHPVYRIRYQIRIQ